MNIFVLHSSPKVSAESLCDKHVVKMSIEYGQILSTVHHILCSPIASQLYKPTHRHHPCVVWAAAHPNHYNWLLSLADWTWFEYHYRYGRMHATSERLRPLLEQNPSPFDREMWAYRARRSALPPMCLPDKYKLIAAPSWGCTMASYREYYIREKSAFARWNHHRPAPAWYTERILQISQIPLDIAS
tara:strand:+ start:1115 stop:1675 length:561 start_codon:yes stop_codon:yes gene_type:complete